MTERAEVFNLYAAARRDLTLRERLGAAPPWPERPAWLAADFGELEMAAIADDFRRVWLAGAPPPGNFPENVPESSEGWTLAAPDDDPDGIMAAIDAQTARDVDGVAVAVLRSFAPRGGAR